MVLSECEQGDLYFDQLACNATYFSKSYAGEEIILQLLQEEGIC